MLSFAEKYAKNFTYSQFGEEGILLEVVARLGIERGNAVEIGGNNGWFCSNTAYLVHEEAWRCLFVECDFRLHQECARNWQETRRVRSQCARVDGTNINIFVNGSCDLLSLDTDGGDFEIFSGLKAKPKIVIIEIDSSYPPDVEAFNSDGGASYRTMLKLGIKKGYFLLCHTANLVLIRTDYRYLFPEIIGDGLSNAELYFNRAHLKEAAA